jgi:hypothetical protein
MKAWIYASTPNSIFMVWYTKHMSSYVTNYAHNYTANDTERSSPLNKSQPSENIFSHSLKSSHYTPRRHYSFSTCALFGGEWSVSSPGRALAPGNVRPVPLVQEFGWASEPVWTQRLEQNPFASAGDRTSNARSSSP